LLASLWDRELRLTRINQWIERSDRPLLGLAILSLLLYLMDLRGLPLWAALLVDHFNMLTDVVFVIDLVLKLIAQGRVYADSPWFLIDFLSCLPVLDTLANDLFPLRAIRFVRGFRILRILRGLRVLRALKTIPAFEQFEREGSLAHEQHAYHRGMNLVLLALTGVVLISIVGFRRSMETEYLHQIDRALTGGVSTAHLRDLGGSVIPPDSPDFLRRRAIVDGREHDIYFDLGSIDRQINRIEFFLTLGMLFSMFLFMYILAYQHLDVTQAQLRGLLNLALPRQVAERFIAEPEVYRTKCRMPATILFMDFVGFTQACEELADDPDRLSLHLEAAMDRLVSELARHDMIIDKFIGDAVMSFRGGPLVTGSASDHALRAVQAAINSIKALDELNDIYFHKVKIGGASDDDCLIGAFGTSARLTYTILGDGVNLAARLEPASAQCGTQNLFAESTYLLSSNHPEFTWRRWGRIKVVGKSEPVVVFEAFDTETLGDPTFVATFHRALEAFERNDFEQARDLFALADTQRTGGDQPSRDYVVRCDTLLQSGMPVGWQPVFETHK
jgi:class 3 adenylate cyclase